MRKTKIMSLMLALTMILSCFSGVAQAEETVDVTITQNSVALDGLEGMPLSFSPTVTFANPLADGTDLSGITLKAGENVLAPTVNQGAVADGVFTTATVVMPVLSNNTEYTLSVPAIGDNNAYEATFKTIDGSYILKEDFNGDIKVDMYQANNLQQRITNSFLKDTDGDSVKDSMFYNLYLHPTINLPTAVPINTMGEVVYDVRVKFTAKSDSYKNSDGTINGDNDGNNGGLLRFYATSAIDYVRVRANDDGEMTYGDANGDVYNTGYKLYNDAWYNIRITLNDTRKMMKVDVSDDNGRTYSGDWAKTSYGGRTITDVKNLLFPYASFYSTTLDYIYVYDNASASLGQVLASYDNGKDLKDAIGVPKTFDATLNFENPITEADMARITVSGLGDATIEKVLEDANTVTMKFAGLGSRVGCTIDVPMIGNNKGIKIPFCTKGEDYYLYQAEFDGYDSDLHFVGNYTTDTTEYTIADGILNIPASGGGWTTSIKMDTPIDVTNKEDLQLDMRIKWYSKAGDEYISSGKKIFRLEGSSTNYQLGLGANKLNDEYKFYYGGNGDNAESSNIADYPIKSGKWYTVKMNFSGKSNKFDLSMVSEDGDVFTAEDAGGSSYPVDIINYIIFPYRYQVYADVDYVRIMDRSMLPQVSATYGDNIKLDGAKNLETEDLTATLKFEAAITEADLDKITIDNGATLDMTLSDDAKTVTVVVSNLANRNNYTITVPELGLNAANKFTFSTKDDGWYIWRAEFDGYDPEMIIDEAGTIENGVFNLPVSAGASVGYVKFDPAIDISANKNLVFEARIKYNNRNASEDGLVKCSQGILMFTGKSINERAAIFSKQGKLAYGGANYGSAAVVTDYDLVEDEWYTFRIKFNEARNKFTLTVSDDNGNVYEGEEIQTAYGLAINTLNEITLQYRFEVSSVIDYFRVWDEDLLPVVEATHGEYEEKLDGAGSVKGGEEVLISFPFAITENDLSKIKLDGVSVSATLSADGKVATVILPALTARTFHELTVDAIGDNKAAGFTFRSADEGKYIYRAEFDGYDDDSVWYTILNGGTTGKNNQNANTEEGVYVSSFQNNPYAAFDPVFEIYDGANYKFNDKTPLESQKIDLAGKENITIETRVKMGEGILDTQFMYMGYAMIMLGIGENGELRYDTNGGGGKGQPFMVNDKEFTIEPDVWYTIKFNLDFAAHKYSVSVDNGMGDIANSGTLNFIYNTQRTNIVDFRFSRMLSNQYATQTIDYFRIIDEDYGKVKVTYDNGIALSNCVLIEADDVYTFTALNDVTNTSDITLFDENGEKVAITCQTDGKVVTIDPVDSEMNYNTKYTLTIPKACIGSDSDQIITFATVWDKGAEFAYPAGYSKNDALNVVFFGGSITNQNGWRKYTTDWFAEKFPNATCYNSAVGGTGSEYGWIRLGKDVISKNPDVVFVEFAVNDSTSTTTTKYMESIVRNLNALDKKPVIIFVYTANINFATNLYTISEHERLAKAYGIPTINIHDYAQSRYNTEAQFATDWDNKVYLSDGTHPSDAGNKLYGEYVTALLTSESSKYFVKPASNTSVKALTDYKDYVYDYKNIDKTLTTSDNTYTLDFTGSELIVQYRRTTLSGKVKIVIDGDEENATVVDTYGDSMPFGHQISFMDLIPGKHTAVITLLTDEVNSNITLGEQTFQIMCAYWKGADAEFNKPVFDADSVTVGKELTATVSYTSFVEEDVYLAIALYDASGRLTRLSKIATTTDSTGVEKNMSVSIIPQSGDVKAKAFIWDSVTDMKALAENAAIGF